MRSLVAAAIVGAAITAVPALALSAPVRDLVGLKGSVVGVSSSSQPGPQLTATLINAVVHHRRGADLVTVTFTVGETGKRPGAGIPKGSEFLIHVSPNRNTFTGLVQARGANGHYTATTVVPDGGIASIQIGGWLNRFGMPTAASGFWVPVVVANNLF